MAQEEHGALNIATCDDMVHGHSNDVMPSFVRSSSLYNLAQSHSAQTQDWA